MKGSILTFASCVIYSYIDHPVSTQCAIEYLCRHAGCVFGLLESPYLAAGTTTTTASMSPLYNVKQFVPQTIEVNVGVRNDYVMRSSETGLLAPGVVCDTRSFVRVRSNVELNNERCFPLTGRSVFASRW